jgi:hypothetical protein
VAAAALGKLVDGTVDPKVRNAAIDALERAAQNDEDGFVRSQAQKSFDALKGLRQTDGSPGGTSGGVASGDKLGGKKAYVELGPFSDKSGSTGDTFIQVARGTAEKALKGQFATKWPGGGSPSAGDLSKLGAKGFYIDGTINKFDVKKSRSNATVSCWVSLFVATFPEKSAFAFANNKKAEVDTGSSAKEIEEAKSYCIEAQVGGLVTGALIPAIQARP